MSSTVPDEVLDVMASAMLEPKLNKTADELGNRVRKEVLRRALVAAEEIGWKLMFIEDVPASDNSEGESTLAMGSDWIIQPEVFARSVRKLKTTDQGFLAILWAFRRAGDASAHAADRQQWAHADWREAVKAFAAEREARTGYRMTKRQIRTLLDSSREAWCKMEGVDMAEVSGSSVKVLQQ